jgi:hypothetical protein
MKILELIVGIMVRIVFCPIYLPIIIVLYILGAKIRIGNQKSYFNIG